MKKKKKKENVPPPYYLSTIKQTMGKLVIFTKIM